MKITSTLVLVCLLAPFGPAVARDQTGVRDWTEYRNERFGFSLRYPAHIFGIERTAEAGDGQVFVAHDSERGCLSGHSRTTLDIRPPPTRSSSRVNLTRHMR
jgi:hypothetical protein